MRDPKERLLDILDAIAAIAAIERHRGRDKAAFEGEELLQVWFLRHLQIIGEAARALPAEVQALAPEIPRTQIIGMWNILVHGYFDIDTDIVWMRRRATCRTSSLGWNGSWRCWRNTANDSLLPCMLVHSQPCE